MIDVIPNIKPGEAVTSRATYKRIKSMDHKELDSWLVSFYKRGFTDGAEAVEQALAEKHHKDEERLPFEGDAVEWETILETIGSVKGIGPKMLRKIEDAVMEVVG